jgi:hypothetical protein
MAVLDIAADLLRANQSDLQLVVIHIRDVRAAAHGNVEAGFSHLFNGGVLQASLRQTQPQHVVSLLHPAKLKGSKLKDQDKH